LPILIFREIRIVPNLIRDPDPIEAPINLLINT